jgi:hypothetical protein
MKPVRYAAPKRALCCGCEEAQQEGDETQGASRSRSSTNFGERLRQRTVTLRDLFDDVAHLPLRALGQVLKDAYMGDDRPAIFDRYLRIRRHACLAVADGAEDVAVGRVEQPLILERGMPLNAASSGLPFRRCGTAPLPLPVLSWQGAQLMLNRSSPRSSSARVTSIGSRETGAPFASALLVVVALLQVVARDSVASGLRIARLSANTELIDCGSLWA